MVVSIFYRCEYQGFSGLIKGDFKSVFLIPESKNLFSSCVACYDHVLSDYVDNIVLDFPGQENRKAALEELML